MKNIQNTPNVTKTNIRVCLSERVEFYLPLDTIVLFGDQSFQAITCTGTENTKQTGENTPKNTK